MTQFTRNERLIAALEVFRQITPGRVLRAETQRLVAEAWTQGEVVYCVSNQYAIQLQCELTQAREALLGFMQMKRLNDGLMRMFAEAAQMIVFTPDEIQAALDRNLAAGLRQLADAIESGAIEGKCIDCQGNGFTGPKVDSRAHLMLRIDLAAPIKQFGKVEG